MSTVAVYNGFGKYEQSNEGQKGMTILFGGEPFWFPYDEVTYLPDYTKREVNHREMTSDDGFGSLQYMTFRVTGEQLAAAMLDSQVPTPNREKGMIVLQNDAKKRKNNYLQVFSGMDEPGNKIFTEVQEIAPSEFEINEAHAKARAYKEAEIQQYFQGKRERMMGGFGHPAFPTGLIREYMHELGISDVDDITAKKGDTTSIEALTEALAKAFSQKAPVPTGGKSSGAQSIV